MLLQETRGCRRDPIGSLLFVAGGILCELAELRYPRCMAKIKETRPEGLRAFRADLHVHTPGSDDFRDKQATAEDIIANAIARDVEILAVTDHNSAEWVDKVRAAAETLQAAELGLTVLPGVEISTPEGHFLGIFDHKSKSAIINDLLVEIGIPTPSHGDLSYISREHAEDVVAKIVKAGGLAIAAHVDAEFGLLSKPGKGAYKQKLLSDKNLAALEFVERDKLEKYRSGRFASEDQLKAALQFSDAHRLDSIAQRYTFLIMESPCLEGLRQALLDPSLRVRTEWEYSSRPHPAILSLKVNQGFFQDQAFDFHRGLNCLIGGKGTGKSTVIELLRFGFGDVSSIELVKNDHDGKMEKLLCAGGVVEIDYLDGDNELKHIRRESQPWETKREVTDAAGNQAEIRVPPVFFSQGEIVQIAVDEIAQLELIDVQIGIEEENEQEESLVVRLRTNAAARDRCILSLQRAKAKLDDPEKGKNATEAAVRRLKKALKAPSLEEFPKWESEQRFLNQLEKALKRLPAALRVAFDELDLKDLGREAPSNLPNFKALATVSDIKGRVERKMASLLSEFATWLEVELKSLDQIRGPLDTRFERKRGEYEKTVAELPNSDKRVATSRLRQLQRRVEELEKLEEGIRDSEAKRRELEKEGQGLRTELQNVRTRRFTKRKRKAREYSRKLKGFVQVSVEEAGNRESFLECLIRVAKGARVRGSDCRKLATGLMPSEVARLVLDSKVQVIAEKAEIGLDTAERLCREMQGKSLSEINELETVPTPDQPLVNLFVGPGRPRPLNQLSSGQKGTVIMALALVEGNGPLVVDQPEEPLDTESIYGQVVKKLREGKDGRQYLFTTHNANIAVSADAELSHVLRASADQGLIERSGTIDDLDTRRLLLVHLEGGDKALRLRVGKYGISVDR